MDRAAVEQVFADIAKRLGTTSWTYCGGPGSWDECLHEHQEQWTWHVWWEEDGERIDRWYCPICKKWRV